MLLRAPVRQFRLSARNSPEKLKSQDEALGRLGDLGEARRSPVKAM
jgi:hypothetical protein